MAEAQTNKALEEATQHKFKQDDLDRAKAMVGKEYANDYRDFLTEATHDSMRNYARSYGDENPLFTDEFYGHRSRWAGQIAPPMLVMVMNKPLLGEKAPRRVGFRGIHNFVSGSTIDWFQPIKKGDVLYRFGGIESSEMKQSEFAGRSLVQVTKYTHINQFAEVVAISRSLAVYVERTAAREKKKNATIEPASYTPEDIAAHDAIYEAEAPRGRETRYWEDVTVGEEMQPLAKGPLTVTDFIIFHAGGYGFHFNPSTGRIGYKNRKRIPAFYIPNDQGIPDIAMRVHWDTKWAQAVGNPMPYDYGILRDSWMTHVMTDWMGDDGWLRNMHSEIRAFNYLGDKHVMTGTVVNKRVENGEHLVDVRVVGTNQRGKETCFANATIALPSRESGAVVLPVAPEESRRSAVEFLKRHNDALAAQG